MERGFYRGILQHLNCKSTVSGLLFLIYVSATMKHKPRKLTPLMFTEHCMAEGFREPTQKKDSFHIGSFLLFDSVLVNM